MATDKNKYRFDEKGFNAEYRSGFGECLLNLLVEFINTKNVTIHHKKFTENRHYPLFIEIQM